MATGSSEVASPNTRLDEKDLAELHRVLYPARNKCNSFGLQIGLGFDEIESIESNKTDSGDRLLAILSVRLNKDKPLTWNEIYSALRSKPVDKRRLAEEIRQKYGHLFEYEKQEIKNVKKSVPKTQKGGDHRARVSKERERSSEYEGIETVRSMKHVQEVESEDEALSRKELLSKKGKRKGGKPAHDKEKQVHDKERVNKKDKFMKDESHSEPEEVREMSKQKKKATHDKEESVSDHNHYSDSEVCRKGVKKRSRKREVNIKSESEASSDEEETQRSSEDDTSHKESAKRKPVTKHTEMKIKVQKEHREDRKDKKDAKSRDIRYSDETKKLSRSKKVETESDKESSSASSSDEEEIEVTKHIDNSKHTETKSADRTKDTTHFESEEKGNKKRVSLKPQSTTAVSPYPELYEDKRGKKAIKVGKSIDSSKETYHKTSSKLPRNQREDQEERVSGKKGTAPPLEQDLPSSEMAETDSGDGESDESSEDENESEQKSSDEEEETEKDNGSSVEEKETKGSEKSRKSKQKASTSTTTTEMRKTKSQDDENSKQKKSSKALSKKDSHGDKEGSDPGGSRDQEDQPKKRNRRRKHRERSKTPIVRGGSSPSSSQEERKKRNKRGRKHNKKSNRKKRERKVKDGASGTDDSSPECDMVKNQSEVEKKELVSVFECFYGQLCCVEFNPKGIAAQLQKKGLISIPLIKELIVSPESQQAKIITLIDALYEMIKSHPEHLFSCIEVMFKNDALQEAGRELLTEAGKQKPSCE